MSKETIHRCDLCKCVIKGQHATLTVPKPKKNGQGPPDSAGDFARYFLMSFGGSEAEAKKYDVCVPCAVGLLRLAVSASELRELEEA